MTVERIKYVVQAVPNGSVLMQVRKEKEICVTLLI